MRPVNLIPPEERRGQVGQARTGSMPYIVLGALVAALLAVTAVVLTGKQISDREAQVAELEAQEQTVAADAQALQPYAEFASLAEARRATVTSLAQSRFDWERPLRELSLVLPDDIWLTDLSASVAPGITLEDAAQVSIRADVEGPALSLVGCGASHESVARFLEVLKDIDGVTRVGIVTDERNTDASAAQAGGADADCRTRKFISRFEIVAAFDAVPTPAAATAVPPAGTAPTTPTATTTAPTTDDGGVGETQATEQAAAASAAQQTEKAQNATQIVPGVAR